MIETSDVSRFYNMGGKKITALADVNIKIKDAEFLAIVGLSGSLKTTLLNIIGRLDRLTNGQVIIDNKDINKLNDKKKSLFQNETISFVFQSFLPYEANFL